MSHHFVDLLDDLRGRLARMCALVQQVVEQSVECVFNVDARLAQQVIAVDTKVDEEEVKVDKSAFVPYLHWQSGCEGPSAESGGSKTW